MPNDPISFYTQGAGRSTSTLSMGPTSSRVSSPGAPAASSLLSQSGAGLGAAGAAGAALAGFGVGMSAVGAYYSTLAQRYQLNSQASSLEFQGSIADINARAAEENASAIFRAAANQKGQVTLAFGQAKSASRTQIAASGLQAGVGSAGEVQASIETAKEIDSMTIELNAVRAISASRSQAVNFRNQAALARVSAANARRAKSALNPTLAGITSLIGSASSTALQFASFGA